MIECPPRRGAARGRAGDERRPDHTAVLLRRWCVAVSRVLTALVLTAIVVPAIKFGPPWLWWGMVLAGTLVGGLELVALLSRIGRPAWPVLAVGGALATALGFSRTPPIVAPVLTLLLLLAFTAALASREAPALRIDRVLGTLFVPVYLGLTCGCLGALGQTQLPGATDRGDMVILAMVAVYVGDISAFYGGRAFGKRKLAPVISPNKTWEGAAAGLLGSVCGALLAPLWFAQALSVRDALVLGLLLGVVGILGDLSESLLKRAAGVKDSGALLPGHGGMLDRADSLLFAAPALYWYYWIVLSG